MSAFRGSGQRPPDAQLLCTGVSYGGVCLYGWQEESKNKRRARTRGEQEQEESKNKHPEGTIAPAVQGTCITARTASHCAALQAINVSTGYRTTMEMGFTFLINLDIERFKWAKGSLSKPKKSPRVCCWVVAFTCRVHKQRQALRCGQCQRGKKT